MLHSLGLRKNSKPEENFKEKNSKNEEKSKKLIRSCMIVENLKGIKHIADSLESCLNDGIQDTSKENIEEIK